MRSPKISPQLGRRIKLSNQDKNQVPKPKAKSQKGYEPINRARRPQPAPRPALNKESGPPSAGAARGVPASRAQAPRNAAVEYLPTTATTAPTHFFGQKLSKSWEFLGNQEKPRISTVLFWPKRGLNLFRFEFWDQIWNPLIKIRLIVLFLNVWRKVLFLAS